MSTRCAISRDRPATVSIAGDIDHCNAHEIVDRVTGAVHDGAGTVVVDLEAVDFMGAAGLGALVRARNLCRPQGVSVTVRCPDSRLRQLFVITALGAFLDGGHVRWS
jgi:anti-anti-sigma factor